MSNFYYYNYNYSYYCKKNKKKKNGYTILTNNNLWMIIVVP